jgi:hypothetical protein
MKPLSREARDALSALKSPEPDAADEARVRQNLERTLGIAIPVAGVAVAASAASAQAATGAGMSGAAGGATALSLGAKVAGLVMAVGLGTTLTVVAVRAAMAPASPVAVVAAPVKPAVIQNSVVEDVVVPELVAPEPEVTVEEQPAIAAAPAPRPTKSAPVRAKPAAGEEPPVAEAPPAPVEPAPIAPMEAAAAPTNTQESYDQQIETQFPNCDAATEMRSALNARKLLDADRAEEAVGLLEAYQRRCPSGRWSNEAWTVRVGGLCMLGRNTEARGFLDWFSSESPERRAAVVGDLHQWCSPELLKP